MSECIFCGIVAGTIPADIVYEDDDVLAFTDINPAAPVHVLIIPRKHIATVNDATADEKDILGALLLSAKTIAANHGLTESGYRVVTNVMEGAGQTVFHIHLHLIGGRVLTWPPG